MADPKIVRVLDLLAQEAIRRAEETRVVNAARGLYDYQLDRWVSDLNTAMTELLSTPEAPDAD